MHLSAFDTPQFEWARSYLPGHPRPVAPVFEPALAARAIVTAANRPRREYWVGWPAVKTIWASRLLPGLAEIVAVRTAIAGQQIAAEPVGHRDGNLYHPVPRAAGATGRFGAEARTRSPQWWCSAHRRVVLGCLAVVAAAAVVALVVSLT